MIPVRQPLRPRLVARLLLLNCFFAFAGALYAAPGDPTIEFTINSNRAHYTVFSAPRLTSAVQTFNVKFRLANPKATFINVNVDKLAASMFTDWHDLGASPDKKEWNFEVTFTGLPADKWCGKFDGSYTITGGGSGDSGGDGVGRFDAEVRGASDGALMVKEPSLVVCRNAPMANVKFTAVVTQSGGASAIPVDDAKFPVTWTINGAPVSGNTATTATIEITVDPAYPPQSSPYVVKAQITHCGKPIDATADLHVVDLENVEALQPNLGELFDTNGVQTENLVTCCDDTLILKATSTHATNRFPMNKPVWTASHPGILIEGADATTTPVVGIDQVTITFDPAATNAVGETVCGTNQTITVESCGTSFDMDLIIVEITSVTFKAVHTPIHPNINAGGGSAIFPGNTDHIPGNGNDTDNRLVDIVAEIVPPVAGIRIYFQDYDVDDPSSDTAPIDPDDDTNGSPVGGDNHGNAGGLAAPFAQTVSVPGDATAAATIRFSVSMQPGDNFRIGAHCMPLDAATDIPANNAPRISGISGTFSEMLTVWRRLHLEVDSMGTVVDNDAKVKVVALDSNAGGKASVALGTPENSTIIYNGTGTYSLTSLDISRHVELPPGQQDAGRFENGRLEIAGARIGIGGNGSEAIYGVFGIAIPSRILDNQQNPANTIITTITKISPGNPDSTKATISISDSLPSTMYNSGFIVIDNASYVIDSYTSTSQQSTIIANTPSPIEIPARIIDDDILTNGSDVPDPDISGLFASLKPAYIFPEFVFLSGFNSGSTSFKVNIAPDPNLAREDQTRSDIFEWGSEPYNNESFWVGYLLGSYEGYTSGASGGDLDPKRSERRALIGLVPGEKGGCLIFQETITEYASYRPSSSRQSIERDTVIHEISHLFGVPDKDPPSVPHEPTDRNANLKPHAVSIMRMREKPRSSN